MVLAAAAPRQQQTTADFETATAKLQEQLDAALAELEQVRDQIEVEKLPLAKRLNELEAERIQVESEAQREVAKLDTEAQVSLVLHALKTEIEELALAEEGKRHNVRIACYGPGGIYMGSRTCHARAMRSPSSSTR